MKFDMKTNSNMQNSVVVFSFSVLDQKYSFWENFVHKNKIFSLSQFVSLSCCQPEKLFFDKFSPKKKNISV